MRRNNVLFFLLLVLISFTLIQCTNPVSNEDNELATLKNAPEAVTVDSVNFSLIVKMNDDFSPLTEETKDSNIYAVIYLVDANEKNYPKDTNPEKLYLINGNEVFEADLQNHVPSSYPKITFICKAAYSRPNWASKSNIDEVVKFKAGDHYYFIKVHHWSTDD